MSPGSLFASRDFRLLLAGQTTSQLGTQVSSVALPLLAVLTLQATAFQVGLGNASLEFVRASGQVIGPGLGGALVSVLSAATVVLIQAVTFAVSAVTLLGVRSTEPPPTVDEARPRLGPQILDGLRFVW